jgi:hypothetical protein
MGFHWLQSRIQEERDRRQREALTLNRLPQALEELYAILKEGITAYQEAFGAETVESVLLPSRIKITAMADRDGRWQPVSKVEVAVAPEIPGFRIERGDSSTDVEVGLLPSNNLYYRDRERDVYLTLEDVIRRVLDRVLFPKLPE